MRLAPWCVVFAVACGSSTGDGLHGGERSSGAGGRASSSGGATTEGSGGSLLVDGSGGAGPGGQGSGGSVLLASGGRTAADGGASATGGAVGGGGVPLDSGGSPGAGGNTPGAGGVAPTLESAKVSCGATSCEAGSGSVCCFTQGGSGTAQAACQPPGNCGFPATEIKCDGPEDCGAPAVCCGAFQNAFGIDIYTRLECRTDCAAPGRRPVCHPNASGACLAGGCQGVITLPATYGVCI